MPDTHKIVGVDRVGEDILVTFDDGRITTLKKDEVYRNSQAPPPDPDKE